MDRLSDFTLGMGDEIEVDRDYGAATGGLKFECIVIATFSCFLVVLFLLKSTFIHISITARSAYKRG